MATTADDSTACGGGAGGKFRKRPFRRPQTTPYDRPPAAVRITHRNNDTTTGGWLSRIVDPASKLITTSAHKLFSSVFRKRLLPPPHPSQDEKAKPPENHLQDAVTGAPCRIQERDMIEGNTQNGGRMTDGVAELEHILNQKTFTRSEIDRLTVLLHSRTVDKIVAEGQERFELTPSEPSKPSTVHSRQKEERVTAFGNGVISSELWGTDMTPSVRLNVNVDVASPTELAKAYMGGRSTRVSSSTLGQQSEAVGEKTLAITTLTLPRPNVSTVQNPISPAGTFQKDFVVPRLRGRSAIYSMARTPYSNVRPTLTKGLGTKNDAFDDHSLLSSQKVLKRRCSVLENDIGSIGPIRRIRQKPNLIYPKPLGLPSSGTPSGTPFTTNAGVGEASSSKSHEDRGEKGGPFSSLHVSSKSVEMGQRILQHLHTLTPPKENSNEKKTGLAGGISGMELTPAMLHGQARKSLETVDLLKYVQHDKVCRTMESSDDLHKAEHPKFYDSNNKVLLNSSNKVYSENGEARIKDGMLITKDTTSVVITSATDVPKRNPAFQMSAHEDFLDMDDDAQLNGVASSSFNEGKTDLGAASSMQSNGKLPGQSSFSEATKEHMPSFTGTKSSSDPALINNTTVESTNTAEKGISSFSLNSDLNKTSVSSTPSTSVPDKTDIHTSTISFGLKSSDKVSPLTLLTSPVMESSMAKDVTSSGFAFADAAIKSPTFNNISTEAVDLSKQAVNSPACVPESSTRTLSSLDSCPLVSAAPSPVLCSFQSLSSGSAAESTLTASNTGANATKAGASAADSTAINGSSNSLASSVAFPSFLPTFGGSSATSDSLTMATLDTDPAGKSKKTDLGTAQGSVFQFRSPTTSSTDNSQLQASHNGSSGSIFIDQVLVSTSASTSTAENISNQAAASALPASSGSSSLPVISAPLTSVSAPLTSSFMFGSSSSVATSGSALNNLSSGLSFGTSSAPENGSSAGSSSSLSSGLIFGAAENGSSNGVPLGASSTSAPSVSTSSVFGYGASSSASSGAPSLTFPFSASSVPATTTIAPSSTFSFGLASAAPASLTAPPSTFSFGATSAPASASSAAPSSTFSFGASSTSVASSSAPSSTFSFGASSTSAASSGAPSSTFSFGASSTSAASSGAPSSTFSFGASASSSAPSSTFSFGASSSAPSSTFSFGASSTSASSSAPSSTFSFGASSTSASSSAPFSTFSFGGSSASASSSSIPSSPFSFGASSASVMATPAPVFPFGSQPPAFGNNASSVFGFGSNLSNDQMNMEDTMLEDSMQSPPTASTPIGAPVFGQTTTSNFSFGMSQASASPFQFASQPNQSALPPNSFQASGSFDGGSFSLGAGGNDKSNRRIVKVKGKNRKK